MNKFRMAKAGINVNEGLKRLMGDMDTYESLLISFLDDKNYDQMCSAIEAGDVKTAFSAGHSLKGIAGNLSMDKLYQAVVPMVETLRAGSLDIQEQLPAVQEAYEKVKTAIVDMKG